MITKIIYWMLNRLFLHHEAQMLESRNSSRRNAVQAALDEYHMTRARDALNVAIEGAVGECKEHAAATVSEAATRKLNIEAAWDSMKDSGVVSGAWHGCSFKDLPMEYKAEFVEVVRAAGA